MTDIAWTSSGLVPDQNKNVWFTTYWGSFLICYSLEQKKIIRLEVLPYKGNRTEQLYSNLIVAGDTVVLVPNNAFEICLYHIKDRTFDMIPVPLPADSVNAFCACAQWNGYIYIFPYHCPFLLKLELKQKRVSMVKDLGEKQNAVKFRASHCIIRDNVYLLSADSNRVFRFDMHTEKIHTYDTGSRKDRFCTISCTDDNRFVLTDSDGNVTVWDTGEEQGITYKNKISEFKSFEGGDAFADSVLYNQDVWLFPDRSDMILKFSLIDGSLSETVVDKNIMEKSGDSEAGSVNGPDFAKFSLLTQQDHCIYGFYLRKGSFFKYNIKNGRCDSCLIEIKLSDKESGECMRDMLQNGMITESVQSYRSLNTFLDLVKSGSVYPEKKWKNKETAGYRIWHRVLETAGDRDADQDGRKYE